MRPIDADELLTAFPIDDEPMLTKSCVRMTIQHMPTIESEPHWIPCSEQMPPMDKYVLVCTVDGDITDGQRWDEDDDGTWFIFGDSQSTSDGDIVAWMPLPEPYEEGKHHE